ncbi:MAG: carboxypeptidase-like regulatory domain-containing protein [Tannerella sp.]|nr:carboxypeptidase-like regulatory domain-containing protein [Tannerella sp.]
MLLLFAVLFAAGAGMTNARESLAPETEGLQQNRIRITGTVIDQAGEPVIGANIVEKGVAANGTVTDADGKFAFEANAGAVLRVSYIGYVAQDIALGNRTS